MPGPSGRPEAGIVLATVKVWPADVGVRGKGGATANLDGVCARRQWAAKPKRISARCSGIATLDKGRKDQRPATPAIYRLGTNPDEAIRSLTLIAARQ